MEEDSKKPKRKDFRETEESEGFLSIKLYKTEIIRGEEEGGLMCIFANSILCDLTMLSQLHRMHYKNMEGVVAYFIVYNHYYCFRDSQ